MTGKKITKSTRDVLLAGSLVLLPAISFFAILLRLDVNIPDYDDYDAILNFLNELTQLKTVSGRLGYFLVSQHNEYKLFTTHAVVWAQYAVFGHVNFEWLCTIGNFFVLLLGALLWKMFLPQGVGLARRLALFVPISLLLFQLNMAEPLDWAMTGIQNLGVVFFALTAIYLLDRDTPGSYLAALLVLPLTIATSINGFILAPFGMLMFLMGRRYGRLVVWLAVSAVCAVAYHYHYTHVAPPPPLPDAHLTNFGLLLRPIFFTVVLGSAVLKPLPGLLLGTAILAYLVYMIRRGYHRKNPLVAWCVLFILITALGVAGVRSTLGIYGATSSRYRIYSDLLLIFVWFSLVDEFGLTRAVRLRSNAIYRAGLVACLVFALVCDGWGVRFLLKRRNTLVQGIVLYEHPIAGEPVSPVVPLPNQPPNWYAWDSHARTVLIRSTQLGIYAPPQY